VCRFQCSKQCRARQTVERVRIAADRIVERRSQEVLYRVDTLAQGWHLPVSPWRSGHFEHAQQGLLVNGRLEPPSSSRE